MKLNLTREQSRLLEQEYINKHKDTLLNSKKVDTYVEMWFDEFNEMFEISSNSPSGLLYKKDNNGKGEKKRYSGDIAGYITSSRGKSYWSLKFNGRRYLVHRIVYLLKNKSISKDLVINHKDNDGLNNFITNLEECTTVANSRKKKTMNKSGHVNIQANLRKGIILGYTFYGAVYGFNDRYFSTKKYGTPEEALISAVNFKNLIVKENE